MKRSTLLASALLAAGAAAAMAAAGNVRSVDTAALQKWLKDDLHVYLPNA